MTEEQSRNYTHVLLENLQAEIRELRTEMKIGFERDVSQDEQMEARITKKQEAQDGRIRLLEHMNWAALGGLGIVGGIVALYGQKILHLLAG